ncbi:pyrophosphatase [Rhizobium hainanense]|uniref:NTP pyrophosphatase, house-cleaning of non-canonical NTPs n=1 Tax=Rhizobium hainanense TaxID=52131 RepID=A0A1C3VXM7_9HYPH|nr:pyrophosphatase [Rhizobium hainanense]SCB32530.1 NTP pyrophosphatase, house-cleaning of non-canonical NTPs [Rhizobium hainanense]
MLPDLMKQFEAASATYAADNGLERDDDWFVLKLQEELGELIQIWNRVTGRGRRKGMSDADLATALADETADVLGHILLFANRNGLDLPAAIERKWLFRPHE